MKWTDEEIEILENLEFTITSNFEGASKPEGDGTLWLKKDSSSVVGEIVNDYEEVMIKKESDNLKGLLIKFGYSNDDF
jgi:hypothetical protein